jgi:hypothetical protein
LLDACELLVLTIDKVALAAQLAVPATPTEESNADALADRPSLDSASEGVNPAYGLMTGYARPLDGKDGFHGSRV